MQHEQNSQSEAVARIVDMRIGLPWLLSAAAAIVMTFGSLVWSLAGANQKLELLNMQVADMRKNIDSRDTRIERIELDMHKIESVNEVQNQRIAAAEERMRIIGTR